MLSNKVAVVYGAAGSIGSTVARAFATSGATVFLAGRSLERLEKILKEILAAGGRAETALVDAMNPIAVEDHLKQIISGTGKLDISINLTGVDVVQDIPLTEITSDDFIGPVTQLTTSRFITGTAAGRIMMKQGSGVILSLTATPGGIGYPYTAGFAPACAAIESFSANLAAELGPYGIRVVNMRSGGSPDSAVFKSAIEDNYELMRPILAQMEQDTMLKKLPPMADIANLAIFLASDMAGSITGVTVDVTAGTTAGLNYRAKR